MKIKRIFVFYNPTYYIKMVETLIPHSIGAIRLEKRLIRFVIKRENLDPHNPILDLNKPTIIREMLSNLLLTEDELLSKKNRDSRGIAYTEKLKFIPRRADSEKDRILLNAKNTMLFNRFLHRLFEELLHEHVANYRLYNPKKSVISGIDSFLTHYKLSYDDYPDVNFEHDSLIKADYRLRHSRNLIGFDTFPLES